MSTSAKPGNVFSLGQRVERGRIDEHAQRLQERPHHVLGLREVDAHLAAHGAIDLGQQGRGDLQETQSAGEGRGDEAGQVADHAAADGHDDRLAIGAEFQHAFPEFGGHFHGLALFAGGDGHDGHLDRLADETFGHFDRVRLLHVFVGEDDGLRDLAAVLEEAAGMGQVAGADFDIVAPLGQIDANAL